ncbi:MAG: DivIVA domain-containing protein [Gemmatimonadaceae bacterium]
METEDTFHLTPVDVRRFDFGSALRGYDRARVDQFRDQVADEFERLLRANADLETKMRSFHEQLKSFRDRDKAINEALVSAQQLREDVKDQATREGDLILREAQAKAEQLTESARGQVATLMREIESLDRSRRAYLAQLRTLAERHLSEVSVLEQIAVPAPESGRGK